MDRATFERETALHREAYQRMREMIRREFAGQYVAMAHGEIIGTAPTFDEAKELVACLPDVPEYYQVFRGDAEPIFEFGYDFRVGGF